MRQTIHKITAIYILSFHLLSCNKLVDVPLPIDKVTVDNLFQTDQTATSAVLGTYAQMMSPTINFSSGAITVYAGLSSDELSSTSTTATDDNEFANNAISTTNGTIKSRFWARPYVYIYQINTCIKGLTESNTLTPAVKNQLLGESRFARAFIYFNMMNLFGDVPLITTTDYETGRKIPRTPVKQIKAQILSDLEEAIKLLIPEYPTSGPVRPNKYTAIALLARYYLYEKRWKEAENAVSQIIDSKTYSLVNDLSTVFLANSNEAIWQLMPVKTTINTFEGNAFIPGKSASALPKYTITKYLLNSFQMGDKRLANWLNYKVINQDTFYYPYKYKVANSSPNAATEYYTVFRLAEQYLIRAEARAEQNDIAGAVSDLNIIRNRARDTNISNALPELSLSLSQQQVVAAVKQENRIELLCEWGHRWFDLIRHNEADAVLKEIKPAWASTDILYPIPFSEILLNTSLTQNPGYN
jgi:hypothetical protein